MTDLQYGMDFRKPEYRREVFLRFYEFHLRWKLHPGAVYLLLPHIQKAYNLSQEESLWIAYINGVTQNIITTTLIYEQAPTIDIALKPEFETWFNLNWKKLSFDADRKWEKAKFIKHVANYKENLGGKTQVDFFFGLTATDNPTTNFNAVWKTVIENFSGFGRLATFSYLEYLKIIGLNISCPSLFLRDINGSQSHRNGLCKVLGRDDLDWHKSNPDFDGKYSEEVLAWLETEGALLLKQARDRFDLSSTVPLGDVNYFTLESTLCCFKSWFRKNRRYPNVYMDMFHDRIKWAENAWEGKKDFDFFWDARREHLPKYLRLEEWKKDPGLKPIKQNHFRETGQTVMMDQDWDCFKNDFNDTYYHETKKQGLEQFFED
jgi:hypothetical protein